MKIKVELEYKSGITETVKADACGPMIIDILKAIANGLEEEP